MSFNWVDLLFFSTIGVSALLSLVRGFIKEALSLVVWLVAGVLAWLFGGSLAQHLTPYIDSPVARVVVACTALFLVTLLAGGLLTFLIGRLVQITGLSGTDRFLGIFFGAARGALLVTVVVGLASLTPVVEEPVWRESSMVPHFLLVADWSKNLVLSWAG